MVLCLAVLMAPIHLTVLTARAAAVSTIVTVSLLLFAIFFLVNSYYINT